MKNFSDAELLDCFIRTSHYLASRHASQPIFPRIIEAASSIPEYEWSGFYKLESDGKVGLHDLSPEAIGMASTLEGISCIQTARQAIETGFLEITHDFHGRWLGFFPLVEPTGCSEALAMGLGSMRPSKRKLKFLLAFSGIAAQALARWRSEQQLLLSQKQLEDLVDLRTRELKREKGFSRIVLEHLDAGVVVCDTRGNLILFNRKAREWHGNQDPEVMRPEEWNTHYFLTKIDTDDPLPLADNPLYRALQGETVENLPMAIRVPGEKKRLIRASASPIWSEDGTFLGAVTIINDITDLIENELRLFEVNRRLTEALQRAEELAKKAEESTKLKSQFLANMSHELRTPMNGILGMAELLNSTDVTPEQKEYLEILLRSGRGLLTLIQDILDFSKIEAGQLELHEEPFTLRELLEPLRHQIGPALQEHGLGYECHYDKTFHVELFGDSQRIRQILANLLTNAAKFTQKGRVDLYVEIEPHADDPEKFLFRFRVCDTGMGVPADKQSFVFEKFSQIDDSNTRRYGGTGLGLAICKQLTDLLGGRIGVRSPLRTQYPEGEGPGSEFWVELQLRSHLKAARAEEPPKPAHLPAEPSPQIAKPRILIVEDNEVNQRMLQMLLTKLGYDSETAANGRIALDVLDRKTFDLVLMDIQMPVLDGLSATREIRALPTGHPAKNIPIIAVTAHAYAEDRLKSLAAGCNEHLVKPVSRALLQKTLQKWLQNAPSPQPALAAS